VLGHPDQDENQGHRRELEADHSEHAEVDEHEASQGVRLSLETDAEAKPGRKGEAVSELHNYSREQGQPRERRGLRGAHWFLRRPPAQSE
jgi:hypothetical protein